MNWLVLHPDTLQRVGWTLVHFAWQATVVAAVLKATLWSCRHQSPKLRYGLACTALLVLTVLPVLTFTLNWGADGGQVSGTTFTRFDRGRSLTDAQILDKMRDNTGTMSTAERVVKQVTGLIHPLLVPITYAWLTGLLVLMLRYVIQWATLRSRMSVRPIKSKKLRSKLRKLAAKLDVRGVTFAVSAKLQSPVTIRFIRPLVLLPISLASGMPHDLILALAAHELAHIRRHDYLVNLLQMVLEHLLFFHPAVWWVSACIRAERENCCDDIALEAVGPVTYAKALERLELQRHTPIIMAPGASDGSLVNRIGRILIGRGRISAAGAIVSIAITCAVLLSASTIFGRTLQPNELWWQIQQTRSISAAVCDAMGVESNSTAFLEPLAQAVAREKPTDQEIEQLVAAFEHGANPDTMTHLMLPNMSATDEWAADNAPGWRYGAQGRRIQLAERLWLRAKAMAPSNPSKARRYALASFILNAQEPVRTGGRMMGRLDNDPEFSRVAQVTERQRERLRMVLLKENEAAKLYGPAMASVRRQVNERLLGIERETSISNEECANVLRMVSQFCDHDRYGVQRQVAQLLWMLRECDASVAAALYADLKKENYGDHWQRWLDEAANSPKRFRATDTTTRPAGKTLWQTPRPAQ